MANKMTLHELVIGAKDKRYIVCCGGRTRLYMGILTIYHYSVYDRCRYVIAKRKNKNSPWHWNMEPGARKPYFVEKSRGIINNY